MSLKHQRGRTRTRARVEDAARVEGLKWCEENNLETVEKLTPTGDPFEVALCPTCKRQSRWLYKTAPAVAECRKCAGLVYRSKSESPRAARIRADPKAAQIAMNQISTALDNGDDAAELEEATNALQICATVTPTQPPAQDGGGDVSFGEIQTAIITDDLTKSDELLNLVYNQIKSGKETHVSRKGDALEVEMRPDSIAKLINSYTVLSNLR